MNAEDTLVLIDDIAKVIPTPFTGFDNYESCDDLKQGYAIDVLRVITEKYFITRK